MITHSSEETIKIGEKLGHILKKGMCVCLYGDLGSGKTTLTKGIGKALGVEEVVNSPTFTILKVYTGDFTLHHIDAYRLENSDDELGITELFEEGITVIEWPDNLIDYLPKEYLEVRFDYIDENEREISFVSHGNRYDYIVGEMKC